MVLLWNRRYLFSVIFNFLTREFISLFIDNLGWRFGSGKVSYPGIRVSLTVITLNRYYRDKDEGNLILVSTLCQ